MGKKGKLAIPPVAENVVILHQFNRGRITPSISPFALKLETYLKITNISYQNDFKKPKSPKGKTPWITLNGVATSDSQLCMELLNRHFSKDLNSHLNDEERAVARSMQIMIEEHLLWVFALWRFVYSKGTLGLLNQIQSGFPWALILPFLRRKVRGDAMSQGIGRHTKEEIFEMGLKDLKAMSAYLGNKPFFTGSKVSELDCAAFGLLAQLIWNSPGSPYEHLFNDELVNLKDFSQRMKETYWPDWKECIKP